MTLRRIDLTTALRPALQLDETLLFVQDAVGLYEGKLKVPDYQNGQAYLTSHRACYIDNEDPRNRAVGVNLKEIEDAELYAGFLKSSPKVTLHPKLSKLSAALQRSSLNATSAPGSASPRQAYDSTPPASVSRTWICTICSYSNPVPVNFDPAIANANTPLPPCLACGIKPKLVDVFKGAIASLSSRTPVSNSAAANSSVSVAPRSDGFQGWTDGEVDDIECPRCTFRNSPLLLSCEICQAPLPSNPSRQSSTPPVGNSRSDSPAPSSLKQGFSSEPTEIKFSFRAGGEKIFFERVKGALVQRKWLLQSAPPVPGPSILPGDASTASPSNNIGIAGLERTKLAQRKNNEVVIGHAFEDLEALMASAKEIIAIAERFASQTGTSAKGDTSQTAAASESAALLSQLNLTTTKDMLHPTSASSSLYLTELSRSLAEFLTDESTGILRHEGGIISLVDLWAVFNRARGGVELVSPTDFGAAAELFEKLRLPVRLRRFKSGLLVVQGRERTDEKTVAALVDWLRQLRAAPPDEYDLAGARRSDVTWDWRAWGFGVTAQEAAERFGWSVGVAAEELEMAEEKGAVCRETGLEGVRFWENWLVVPEEQLPVPNRDAVAA